MKTTVKHYLTMRYDPKYMANPEFFYSHIDMHTYGDETYATIKEVDFELVIPDDFDPRQQQIAALERQHQKAMADYELLMNTIEGKIQSLRCIEHKSEETRTAP